MTRKDPHTPSCSIEYTLHNWSDSYFGRTKSVVERYGDVQVKQVVFMRRPVVFAPRLCFDWLDAVAVETGQHFDIQPCFLEGQWAGAGMPLFTIEGSFAALLECETQVLQSIGAACVAAYNAYNMCAGLPKTAFLAMEARHCAGLEMSELMSYAASVGSARAKRKADAIGFIGGSCHATAHYFDQDTGLGTMPHGLIGYAGSTLRAAEMFHAQFPDQPMTVLVDFFGKEIDDALEVCHAFRSMVKAGQLSMRIDTHGGRFLQGLDTAKSYAILEHYAPEAIKGYCSERELRFMIGTGVSAAAIWRMREALDKAGFAEVKIVGSSGFGPEKCRIMALTKAPIDVVGTGSFIPDQWSETFATCDAVSFDGKAIVKSGREFLLEALAQRKPHP